MSRWGVSRTCEDQCRGGWRIRSGDLYDKNKHGTQWVGNHQKTPIKQANTSIGNAENALFSICSLGPCVQRVCKYKNVHCSLSDLSSVKWMWKCVVFYAWHSEWVRISSAFETLVTLGADARKLLIMWKRAFLTVICTLVINRWTINTPRCLQLYECI